MAKIGTVTINSQQEPIELRITELVRATFKDHRLCTVARTEENTFVLAVENPSSTGRLASAQIHLSEESMLALVNMIFVYYIHKGLDFKEVIASVSDERDIQYEYAEETEPVNNQKK